MAAPVPSTFYAGQRWRAADVNAEIRDNLSWAMAAKVCRVQRSGSQAIASGGAGDAILFTTEDFDPMGWHNSSVYPNLIVPDIAGYYQIHASLEFVANATGHRRAIISAHSFGAGPYWMASASAVGHASIRPMLAVSTIVYLNGTDDYVQLIAYQDSGSDLNTSVADGVTTSLCVSLIGT